MDIFALIQSMLTPQMIALMITNFKKKHKVKYQIRDLIYGNGIQHPFSTISVSDLTRHLSNIPVVRRGTTAYALDKTGGSLIVIDPQGIDVSDKMMAKDINDLKLLMMTQGNNAIKKYLEGRINDMLITVQKSIEALSAQSLTGTISYPMKTDSGVDLYEVEFGDTLTFNFVDKLTPSTSLADVYTLLSDMHSEMQESEYGDDVVTLAGSKAFGVILNIVGASKGKSGAISASITAPGELDVGGFKVIKVSGKYRGVNNVMTDKIDPSSLCMIDLNASHSLYYLALDDIDAGLQPLPFFTSHEITKDPSAVKLIGRSKPLPAPVTRAIIWCNVLA